MTTEQSLRIDLRNVGPLCSSGLLVMSSPHSIQARKATDSSEGVYLRPRELDEVSCETPNMRLISRARFGYNGVEFWFRISFIREV